jgi:NAD+ kinase
VERVVKTIAIFYQGRKQDTSPVAAHLEQFLHKQGYQVRSIDLRKESEENEDPSIEGCDLVIVLGGDGTILHAARLCAYFDVPILGIDFGRVGFLSELEPNELTEQLPYYLDGDKSVWIDKRSMLQATIEQEGKHEDFLALNDIVIARGMWPRMVEVHIWIDGYYYNTSHSDGVVLCTATGSTAYNMALGGPLLHPQVQSIVLTPIAPHLAFDRSLIMPPEATIKLQIFTGNQAGVFSADGQMNREITDGATITIHRSKYFTQFLRRKPPTHFYQIITAKLSAQVTESHHAT